MVALRTVSLLRERLTSMERRICFYNETPLTQRDYERFGFEIFLYRGFEVYFLDMTQVLHPDYLANYEPPDLSSFQGVVVARSQEDILTFVEKNHKAFAVSFVRYDKRTHFLYRAFKRFNVQYAQYESISIPVRAEPTLGQRIGRLWEERRKSGWFSMSKLILSKLSRRCGFFIADFLSNSFDGVQPPRYSLRAARKAFQISPKLGWNSEIVGLHYWDYDLFLQLKQNGVPERRSPYCVFLDEYFPFHPDFFITGYTPLEMNADKYYEGLNRFFDFIEQNAKLPVIVAAHPRARYDQRPDYFRGRRVVQFKTSELVAGAEFVIAHETRSINFAVMFRKPVIFLTSDEIEEKTVYGSYIRNFAATLGKKPLNVDGRIECDLDKELVIDEERYREYFENYIKIPGTPEKPYWEVVADKIEQDYFS